MKTSKLPVTSFRRSLNLDNSQTDPSKCYKTPTEEQRNDATDTFLQKETANRNNLKLDINVAREGFEPPGTSTSGIGYLKQYRNYHVPDDNSLLSPCDDSMSCDSWSVCSDYHAQDLTSPISPCGHFYSADENESVSDRIRRKSFYTRFNEKKRPRKTTVGSYRDLDLYKDMNSRKSNYRASDFSSLDHKVVDLESCKDRTLYYPTATTEPLKRGCVQNNSVSFVNNDYVNVPGKYQTYNSKIGRCSSDFDEMNTLDEPSATGRNRIYSYYTQPSRFNSKPTSPLNESASVQVVSTSVSQSPI